MKRSDFRRAYVALLLLSSLALLAIASVRDAAAMSSESTATIGDAADIAAIKQLGRSMGDAMVAVDTNRLNEIYADDWAAVSGSGKIVTKQSVLQNVKSGTNRLIAYELGPIDVQVVGDVAVAEGTVKEERSDGFKGVVLYSDLLRKRAGRWVVVRSSGARVHAGN